jgi:membrane protein
MHIPRKIFRNKILRELFEILQETYLGWSRSNATLLAAALSYYTIFSLTPLLVAAVSVSGLVFSESAVIQRLVQEVAIMIGPSAAQAVETILQNNHLVQRNGRAAIISSIVMLVGASMMFVQLKRAINILWGIAPHPQKGLFVTVRTHFLSFLMVFVVILMILGLMILSTLLVSLNQMLAPAQSEFISKLPRADFGLTVVGFTLLFAVIFKLLPDARVAWRDVLLGSATTSLLFTIGGFLLGLYLGNVNLYSVYGAASSVFLLLVWVYYSMQIILFGAKLTQVLANRYGSQIIPSKAAARILQQLEIDRDTQPRVSNHSAE